MSGTAPALFDLEPPPEVPLDRPALRPVWSTVTCHTCQEPLRRFVRQQPDGSWYRYELDHTAWDHLRAHEGGRLLLRLTPWGIGSTNAVQRLQGVYSPGGEAESQAAIKGSNRGAA